MSEQVVFFRIEAEGVGELVDQLGQLKQQSKELQKDLKAATDPKEFTKLNRQLFENKESQQAITKAIKEQTKATKEQTSFAEGSYRALNKELVDLRRAYKELSQAEREGPGGAESLKRIQKLDLELKQLDSTMGQFQRNVGNYPGGGFGAFVGGIEGLGGPLGDFIGNVQGLMNPLQDLAAGIGSIGKGPTASATAGMEGLGAAAGGVGAGAMVATAGIAAAAVVLAKSVSDAAAFEESFAQLSATLGVSGDEADRLKNRIDELQNITLTGGARIVSTSKEIADAFTVVGSAAPQLLKNQAALQAVSKEVIVFSKSAGTDLAEAAKVVTGAINLFGLEASEAARVINVLAAGEKEGSATTLEAAEALEKAGGAAKITGASIEETTAAIQLLAKDSIKGSEAGTALRNVLLKIGTASEETLSKDALAAFERGGVSLEKLRDTTVPLNEKLNELKKLTGDTAGLTAVFGTENINAAITLTKYADEFPKLTSAITGTNVAYEQASVKQSTFNAQLANFSTNITNITTSIGTLLLPALNELLKIVNESVTAFTSFQNFGDYLKNQGVEALTGFNREGEKVSKIKTGFLDAATGSSLALTAIRGLFGYFVGPEIEAAKAATNAQTEAVQELGFASDYWLTKLMTNEKQRLELAKKTEEEEKKKLELAKKNEEERLKIQEQTNKKAAEEAEKRRREEERLREENKKTLAFYEEQIIKVRAELEAFSDPALVPKRLIEEYNSLTSTFENLKKQLDAFYKKAEKPVQLQTLEQIKPEIIDAGTATDELKQKLEQLNAVQMAGVQKGLQKFSDNLEAEGQIMIQQREALNDQLLQLGLDFTQESADAFFEVEQENADRRKEAQLAALEADYANQLELVAGNAQAEQDVREDYDRQRMELERQAFEEGKQRSIAQALINAALAITNALATTQPLIPAGIIAAAAVAASTAVQIGAIAAQQFALGGRIGDGFDGPKAEHGIFVGPSHADGGINTRLSGRRVNVEGGEYFERLADGSSVVVNKRSTSMFKSALMAQAGRSYPGKLSALSAINQYGGGVPLMATGGVVAPMTNAGGAQSTAQLELLGLALDKLSNRVPVLTLQSFDTVNSRANQVKTLQGL